MFRTANPAWNAGVFEAPERLGAGVPEHAAESPRVMTLQGAVNKTFILLTLCAGTAVFAWGLVLPGEGAPPRVSPMLLTIGGAIVGLIFAIATIIKPRRSPVTAPLYALAEGFFVGGISAVYATVFAPKVGEATGQPNTTLILQAVLLTFGILAAMLIAYTSRLIKPTENFKLGVVSATGGIMIFYLVSWVLGMFGVHMGIMNPANGGWLSIGFSLFVVVIAALNLVLDFDFIEQGVERGAPKWAEWFGGFALLVTLVWLYIEILRLLAKIQSRE